MRLERGKLYELDGRPYRCTMVNECRARLSPDWRETRQFLAPDGSERTVRFTPPGLDVSPNSVLRKWCPDVGPPLGNPARIHSKKKRKSKTCALCGRPGTLREHIEALAREDA